MKAYVILDSYHQIMWPSEYIPAVDSTIYLGEKEIKVIRVESKYNQESSDLEVAIYCNTVHRERSDTYPL